MALGEHSPLTNNGLTATATDSDPYGKPVTLTYVWTVNGAVKQTFVSTALTDSFNLSVPGNGDKGDTIVVAVTPNDGIVSGAAVTDTATVADTPSVATVVLNEHAPLTNDLLIATATKSDADGDPVSLTFVWTVDGTVKRTFTSATATSGELRSEHTGRRRGRHDRRRGDAQRRHLDGHDRDRHGHGERHAQGRERGGRERRLSGSFVSYLAAEPGQRRRLFHPGRQ